MATLQKYNVLDDNGLDVLLAAIFKVIEENYVRKTTYEADMEILKNRITELQNSISSSNS